MSIVLLWASGQPTKPRVEAKVISLTATLPTDNVANIWVRPEDAFIPTFSYLAKTFLALDVVPLNRASQIVAATVCTTVSVMESLHTGMKEAP